MGNMKDLLKKSLQLLDEATETSLLKQNVNPQKDGKHVFLQQSVTLLAFKDKLSVNATATPGAPPKLLFGIIKEDLPLFIGAIIGASLVIALCVLILILWKCCCRMTILSKKKEYWLQPKDTSNIKGKTKYPTVQSSSVVFLGLKPTQDFAYRREKSSEDCTVFNFFSNSSDKDLLNSTFDDSMSYTMSSQCPDVITSDEKKIDTNGPTNTLPNGSCSNDAANQPCSVISASALQNGSINCTNSSILSPNDISIPSITIHQESPALFHRSFYSGNFDQHSLYSCDSHPASEIGVRKCNSFTWSNYSLRPSSSDCYYDLFQKANFCKKRKNRMRSDIAAAIALNRSQSSQLNKDTELLVENEVEVVLAERTTL